MSGKILQLLSKSEFDKGIRHGVPKSIKVANKFGARSPGKDKKFQLHDCGIVYKKNPYLLCVMTKGPSLKELGDIIRGVSQTILKEKKVL